jgi:hypothetical protein
VFHIDLLTPYRETPLHGANYKRPPPDLIEGEEEYEVEKILSSQRFGRGCKLQYLVKWKGYPDSENQWVARDDVFAEQAIREFKASNPEQEVHIRRVVTDFEPHHSVPRLCQLPGLNHIPLPRTTSTLNPRNLTSSFSGASPTMSPYNTLGNTPASVTSPAAHSMDSAWSLRHESPISSDHSEATAGSPMAEDNRSGGDNDTTAPEIPTEPAELTSDQ